MPHQRTKILEQKLTGLAEICQAVEQVEELRGKGIDAKIEVEFKNSDQSEKRLLHSVDELQEFINHLFSRMLVYGISTSIPLDDFEQAVSTVSISLLDESQNITGRLIL